jgi:hypothetical protein
MMVVGLTVIAVEDFGNVVSEDVDDWVGRWLASTVFDTEWLRVKVEEKRRRRKWESFIRAEVG